MRMLQGHANASTDSALGLQQLAAQAAQSEELRRAVAAGGLEGLASVQGGPEFQNAFAAYLNVYGWRLPGWIELRRATWSEDPSVPLRMISRYPEDGAAGPDVATANAAAGREDTISEAKATLNPDERAQLDELLAAATGYVELIERRALWQQQLFAYLRVPLLVLGEKLVASAVLAAADDVFQLTLAELEEGLQGTDLASTVRERRADLERWAALIPPQVLGTAPSERPEIAAILMDGAGLRPSDEPHVVNGFAASPDVVQGRARVVTDLAKLGRVEPGDVLVTRFTAPTWTPAFGVASAVVTDAGGVLSHGAIAAREYALPAVVGTQVGTTKIPDGALVTVDGNQGVVRIDEERLG